MSNRGDLVQAIHQAQRAQDGGALTRAVAALDNYDRQLQVTAAADRETDLGVQIVAERLTPAALHEFHTAATDWLAEDGPVTGDANYRTAMIAEASAWYHGLDAAVRADPEEFAEQARGRARTAASAYGYIRGAAQQEFLQTVGYLHSTEAASGLPQIDQTVDPNNQPSATPYPTEVFPTFGQDQDEFNGVETNAHGSGATSERAPMIQQIEQQNSSGSGFGSGPEKPLDHSTGFDTANSYAEVPLGPPGQISTAPAATDSMGSSHPNPVAGTDQDAGADRRQAVAGYSYPDPFGYRWAMLNEVVHPFHERCGSAHWPDESCGDRSHTASVAIAYTMDLDQARRAAACERVGVQEGLRAVAAAQNIAELGQHHNRIATAWGASDRTADDTAVLHGFMAVVRPVLAEVAHEAGKVCGSCRSGNCQNCSGDGCTCPKCHKNSKTAAAGLAAGGVTDSEREHAAHHLPGTDKFPVDSAADVRNAKHDIGRTNEPHGKVVRYINEMASEYGVSQVGGDNKKAASLVSRLDFKEGASSLTQVQQITDPNNQPSPEDDQLPAGVMFPIGEGLAAQWVTGPGGAQPKAGDGQQHEAARDTLPQGAAQMWGHLDAQEGKQPQHKRDWQYSPQRHGDYIKSYSNTAGVIHGMTGRAAMSRQEYASKTGRPDLHGHYLQAYAEGRKRNSSPQGPYGEEGLSAQGAREVTADAWSEPRQTTDDINPPYNSPDTTPPPSQDGGDYAAGQAAGKADRAAGSRPAFADNSSGVSPYVKGYAEGYGAPGAPQGAQDVPGSMGGDSGQAVNVQEAQQSFQRARASLVRQGEGRGGPVTGRCPECTGRNESHASWCSHADDPDNWAFEGRRASLRRVSAAFAPDGLMRDPDFAKAYKYAQLWEPGGFPLVKQGSAAFEAGLYAGITDQPAKQAGWLSEHYRFAGEYPELARRIELHASFTRKHARKTGGKKPRGIYLRAGTSTDLITDGPGTSPDPMGSTPINGPGTPPPMAGMDNANAPGGSPPYQGAPPLPGGPVAPDDVMGKPQEKPQQSGPFTNTFSGDHPGNADLAPVAPNSAAQPGYSNKDAYKGDPFGGDRVAKLAAFRATVQQNLSRMGAQ
jgi:hypothetical protein